jgi:hypothetical protein
MAMFLLLHAGMVSWGAVRLLVRDRDGKFPEMFDGVLADAGSRVVLTDARMNAIMER